MRSFHDWRNPQDGNALDDPLGQAEPRADDVWRAITVGVVYFLCTQLSRLLDAGSFAPALIWPADGVAIGMLLMMPASTRWLGIGAVLFANICNGAIYSLPIPALVFGSLTNMVQVGASVMLLQSVGGSPIRALSHRILLVFIFVVVGLINLAAALSNALVARFLLDRPFGLDLLLTFTSDAMGIYFFTPLIVAWGLAHQRVVAGLDRVLPFRPWRVLEALAALSVALVLTAWLFGRDSAGDPHLHPQVYVVLPAMLWIAMRFGLRMVSATLVLVALVAVYQTAVSYASLGTVAAGIGPILETQGFLMAVAISVSLTASVLNERRVAENATRALESTFQSVLRASDNLVFEIDPSARTVRWIGDPERVVGWSAATISTVDQWNARVHPEDRYRLHGIRQQLMDGTSKGVDIEYRVINPAGDYATVGVNAYGADILDARTREPRRRIIGFVKNITRQKQLAKEREELAGALRQAQKMEAIGQLTGGIAHDFNNVLAAILGYAELAKEKLKQSAGSPTERDAALARYVATIERAGERGRGLTSQILTFSRAQPDRSVLVDLKSILEEVVALIRGSHVTPVELEIHGDAALEVMGDATSLHQLLMNLCTNGMQAIEEAGRTTPADPAHAPPRLTLEAEAINVTQTLTTAQGLIAPGDYARITVTDTGPGMSAEIIERIFEPFFTTKVVGKGTGLGLSLALSIARSHGGGLNVESTLGVGTRFSVYLPLAKEHDGTAGDTTSKEGSAIRGLGEEVLLVDDDADLRDVGYSVLSDLGYRVTVAESGAEALAIFNSAPERFAAVVSDEVMPELTGTQLAARVHERRANLPFIIVTAYGGTGFALRAQQAGVFRILSKPYRAESLGNALAAALSQSTPLPPSN